VHTHLIDDHADALLALPDDTAVQQALAVLAQHLRQAPVTHAADPWARGDGWRLHGRPTLQGHVWWLDATPPRRLPLPASWPEPSLADTTAIDTVNIATCTVVPRPAAPGTPGTAQAFDVFTPAGLFGFVRGDPLQEALQAAHTGSASGAGTASLNAPMPGRVVAIDVQAGQHVQAGQRLAVTEAMKMEHAVCAPHDGVVSDVLCAVGEAVAQGQPLLRLSRDDAPTPPTASPAP
jgi:biotin carboxyl carrier protein